MFMVWWNIFKGTCKVSVYFVIRSHQGCTYCKGSSYLTWLVSDCEWGLKFSDCALASLQCLRKDMWIWENIWLNPAKSYLLDILKKRGKNQKKKLVPYKISLIYSRDLTCHSFLWKLCAIQGSFHLKLNHIRSMF